MLRSGLQIIKKLAILMPDKDGCGCVDDYDNEAIEKAVADHWVKWPLESLVNESANDFVKRLVFEWQQISNSWF